MASTLDLTHTTTLEVTTCGVCAVPFAMPRALLRSARQDGSSFWCPNGHNLVFTDTDNAKLKRQLAEAERTRKSLDGQLVHERDQRQAAQRSAIAYKGQATRLRNRASAGVCPVSDCHRHFANLERHMETKHPGFGEAS